MARKSSKESRKSSKESRKSSKESRKSSKASRKSSKASRKSSKESRKSSKASRKSSKESRKSSKASRKSSKASRKSSKASRKSSKASRKFEEDFIKNLYELDDSKNLIKYNKSTKIIINNMLKKIVVKDLLIYLYRNENDILNMDFEEFEGFKNLIIKCSIDLIDLVIKDVCKGILNKNMIVYIQVACLIISLKLIGSYDIDLSKNMEKELLLILGKNYNIKISNLIIDILKRSEWKGCKSLYI